MNTDEKTNLKLICNNQDDLKVLSAYLQDSVVNIKDIVFLKKNRTFVMIVNRFMWEDVEKGIFRRNKRIRCAIKFEEVFKVMSKNINQENKNRPLECLAIKCAQTLEKTYEIKIFFAGNSIITIKSEAIEVVIHDLGKPWNVKHIPQHKI
tara:strand:+ start:873 stop:1322 length:450 start_codon:yes stop_codon:yes gene_type:complete